MKTRPRLPIVAALVPLLLALAGCRQSAPTAFQGYIEGEYVYVASPSGGRLEHLHVQRGDSVTNAQPLFALELEPEQAAVQTATARLAQAKADLANRRKGLRPSEIAALEAELNRLETDHALAQQLLTRRESAHRSSPGSVSQEDLDQSRSRVASLKAAGARLEADLETARLGAREDEIQMAADAVAARAAELEQARWTLSQKSQTAPTNAVVHDTLYREGEWVGAGKPIVSLLPPRNIKVRFFVPETELAGLRIGQTLPVRWDGANRDYSAEIRYISTRTEYTPPVIYSQETRAKLVFLVEAFFSPSDAVDLKVGQPVDVYPPARQP